MASCAWLSRLLRIAEIPQSRSPKFPSWPWGGEGWLQRRSAPDDHLLSDERSHREGLTTVPARRASGPPLPMKGAQPVVPRAVP